MAAWCCALFLLRQSLVAAALRHPVNGGQGEAGEGKGPEERKPNCFLGTPQPPRAHSCHSALNPLGGLLGAAGRKLLATGAPWGQAVPYIQTDKWCTGTGCPSTSGAPSPDGDAPEMCGSAAGNASCGDGFTSDGPCCSEYGYCGTTVEHCGAGCQPEFGSCDPMSDPMPESDLCGMAAGGASCPDGTCCSEYGFCGDTSEHCGVGCQPEYGTCSPADPQPPTPTMCGAAAGGASCEAGACCSQAGQCGTDTEHCGVGCQSQYGTCSPVDPQPPTPTMCGAAAGGTSCAAGACCSQSGQCGTDAEHCGAGCQPQYGTCNPANPGPGTPSPDDGTCPDEDEVLRLHNQERAARGTAALTWSTALAQEAAAWAAKCTPNPNDPTKYQVGASGCGGEDARCRVVLGPQNALHQLQLQKRGNANRGNVAELRS